jgi:molybdenum cofactor guanylyltransferase
MPSTPQRSNNLSVYYQIMDPVTAFVLAGGKSSRMGQDKAFLQLGGKTLLTRALETAAAVGKTHVVGSSVKFADYGSAVEDLHLGHGPLGGIHAALSKTSTDLNLMLAVDLPFVEARFLRYLVSRARETRATVVLPRTSDGLQPLCATYRRSFMDTAEQSLRAGRNKINALFTGVPIEVIEPEELEGNGFAKEMFRNLNTPADWEDARQRTLAEGQKTDGRTSIKT